MRDRHFDDDDDIREERTGRRFTEFDCPDCNANNPHDEGFRVGDQVMCFYCGAHFRVRDGGGKPRFVEA